MKQLILIICGFCAISGFGQVSMDVNSTFTLSKVVMLDLYPKNSTVTFSLSSAIEAGEQAIVVTTNNNQWINFSSALAIDANSRSISVNIDGGQVPSGINLKLNTEKFSVSGNGELGSVTITDAILNDQPQTIVSGIRGAYTGYGENGYKLTYSLYIYDYALLDFNQTANLTITLTLNEFQ